MSIEAVVGRIDQIMVMRQQLADPAAAAQSASGTASAGSAPTTSTPASFSAALESALGASAIRTDSTASATGTDPRASATGTDPTTSALGIDPTAALGTDATAAAGAFSPALATLTPAATTIGSPTETAGSQVEAMINMANSLVGKPYVYGGGHSGWGAQDGYDCSGFVSAVLHAGGYLNQPVDTTALPQQPGMEPGPGQHVTVYDRALPGQSGHVIIEIDGQFYESGGSRGEWGGGGGVEKIGTPSAAYLATFPNVVHPAGL
jgi:cell wall-associated NlpC family hydrolase